MKLEKSSTYAKGCCYYYHINSIAFPEALLSARHLYEALGIWRPTREPQCCPRGSHSLMEDRRAMTHRDECPDSRKQQGCRSLSKGPNTGGGNSKRLPGGGDKSTETWRRRRIWPDGKGWEAERTAHAKVQRHKKNDILGRTEGPGPIVGLQGIGRRRGLQCRPHPHLLF